MARSQKWKSLKKSCGLAIAVFALVLAVMAQGCGGSGGSTPTAKKTYTIFVYGHGDHDLTGSLLNDLNKMAAATLNDNINLIVATDWNAAMTKPDQSGKYVEGTEWYNVTGGGAKTLLKTDAEQNLDDPANLTAAVTYAFSTYPANHYGVILWNHGGAWENGFGGDTQNGTLSGSQIRGMTNIEAHDAISAGLTAAGVTGTRPLDFLAFDTCLLGAAELTQLMKDLAQVYIANAELDFGSGWNYTATFTDLAAGTTSTATMTPAAFAAMEIEKWDDLHKTATYSDELLRSHVAIDATKVDDFTTAVKNLVDAINATATNGVLPDNAGMYSLQAALSIPSYGMTSGQGSDSSKYRDLGQFLTNLANNSAGDIQTKATAAKDALAAMVIGKKYGTLRDPSTGYQLAFNIGLPEINLITDALLADYATKAKAWSDATGWGTFLTELKASKSSVAPSGTFNVASSTATFVLDATATNSTTTFGTLEVLAVDPADATKQVNYGAAYFGTIRPASLPNTYTMLWDGKIWKAGDQIAAVLPWMYLANEINTLTAGTSNLLGAYGQVADSGGGTATAVLLFGPTQTSALAIATQSPDGDWDSSKIDDYVRDHPGVTFKPALLRVNPASGESNLVFGSNTAVALPSSGGVAVSQADAGSGTFTLYFTGENAWGNKFEGSGTVTR